MAYSPAHMQYGYAPATTVGTALASNTATTGLQIKDRPSINPGITYHETPTARNAAFLHTGDVVLTQKMPTFSFSCPVSAYVFADFVFALFQNIVSEATTPFGKVIAPAIGTMKSIDVGAIVSTEIPHCLDIFQLHSGAAGTDDDFQLISGVPSEITVAMQDGLWHMTVAMAGFDADFKALDYTGTVTAGGTMATAGKRYLANMYVKIGGVESNAQDVSLTMRNGLGVYNYAKGTPKSMLLSAPGMSATLTMNVPLDVAEARSLITLGDPSATAFVPGVLTPTQTAFIIYGPNSSSDAGTAADDVAITLRGHVQLTNAATGSDQVMTQISVNATYDGTNAPVSVGVCDSTNRAWI